MENNTYKIKKGDTLSQIAKQYGVGISDITGYRSGDPNKIFEGETITIGKKTAPEKAPEIKVDDYSSTVKKELANETDDFNYEDPYGLAKVRGDYDTYKANRQKAYDELKTITTSTFDTEYKTKGLDQKKAKMTELDGAINIAKKERDDAINKIRTNPGLSASQMTGDIKKIADYQNNIINNLIEERNGVATEYNTGLEEIDRIVSNKTKEKELDYKYWNDLFSEAGGLIDTYTKSYREGLKEDQQQSNFEKQLAQALQIAQMKDADGGSTVKLDLVTDKITGQPSGTFNPRTGAYTPYEAGAETKSFEDKLYDQYSASDLEKLAKTAGYTKGGFLGMGKKGDVDAYIQAIKNGLVASPI